MVESVSLLTRSNMSRRACRAWTCWSAPDLRRSREHMWARNNCTQTQTSCRSRRPLPPMKLSTSTVILLELATLVALVVCAAAILVAWVSPKAPALTPVGDEQVASFSEGQIRFEERAEGAEAILLLHGFNGQLGDWNQVWSSLNGCGHALRLDIPGFGASRWDTQDFSLPAQARRILDFLDARGIARVTLVGTSMGGSLAAWIAAEHPKRVTGLLLLAPSGFPDSLHYSGLFGVLVKPGPANRVGGLIASNSLYSIAFPRSRALQATSVTASYGAPWADALTRISAPTMLIWSRGDTSFHAAADVQRLIRSSQLVTVAHEAGHLLAQTRPELAAAAACLIAKGARMEDVHTALRPILRRAADEQ